VNSFFVDADADGSGKSVLASGGWACGVKRQQASGHAVEFGRGDTEFHIRGELVENQANGLTGGT